MRSKIEIKWKLEVYVNESNILKIKHIFYRFLSIVKFICLLIMLHIKKIRIAKINLVKI